MQCKSVEIMHRHIQIEILLFRRKTEEELPISILFFFLFFFFFWPLLLRSPNLNEKKFEHNALRFSKFGFEIFLLLTIWSGSIKLNSVCFKIVVTSLSLLFQLLSYRFRQIFILSLMNFFPFVWFNITIMSDECFGTIWWYFIVIPLSLSWHATCCSWRAFSNPMINYPLIVFGHEYSRVNTKLKFKLM